MEGVVIVYQKYDVVIIGAGPAGLECANQLKDTYRSVLLIERNAKIGTKVCAGGITPLDEVYCDLPYERMRSFYEQYVYIYGRRHKIDLFKPIRTVEREILGEYQLEKLAGYENITVLTDTLVKEIREDRVVTTRGVYYFDILIGADGANSLVRRFIGLPFKHTVGIYYEIDEVENEMKWIFMPQELGMGYIWVFPHETYTNIGIYFDPDVVSSSSAKKLLEEYLQRNRYSFDPHRFKASVINTLYKGYRFGNIYLIGEAAGFTSKLTGEGISFALLSGRTIGRIIAENDVEKYRGKIEELLAIKKRQESLERLFYRFKRYSSLIFDFIVLSWKLKKMQKWFWGL